MLAVPRGIPKGMNTSACLGTGDGMGHLGCSSCAFAPCSFVGEQQSFQGIVHRQELSRNSLAACQQCHHPAVQVSGSS